MVKKIIGGDVYKRGEGQPVPPLLILEDDVFSYNKDSSDVEKGKISDLLIKQLLGTDLHDSNGSMVNLYHKLEKKNSDRQNEFIEVNSVITQQERIESLKNLITSIWKNAAAKKYKIALILGIMYLYNRKLNKDVNDNLMPQIYFKFRNNEFNPIVDDGKNETIELMKGFTIEHANNLDGKGSTAAAASDAKSKTQTALQLNALNCDNPMKNFFQLLDIRYNNITADDFKRLKSLFASGDAFPKYMINISKNIFDVTIGGVHNVFWYLAIKQESEYHTISLYNKGGKKTRKNKKPKKKTKRKVRRGKHTRRR